MSAAIIGYVRVSTDDQNLDLQRDALTRAGCTRLGPVTKFFRARFSREFRSAEPVSAQLWIEMRASGSPIHNQKLGRPAFSRRSHTGRKRFATGPLVVIGATPVRG